MSLLQHCRRVQQTSARAALSKVTCVQRTLHSAAAAPARLLAAATPSAAPSSTPPVWPAPPSAAAPTSASAADGAAAISDSQAARAAAAIAHARYHRRARLWLLAFVTSASTLVTSYRYLQQTDAQEKEMSAIVAEIAAAKGALTLAQEQQAQRKEQLRAQLDQAAPPPAASQPGAAPSSFLGAVALDVKRSVGLAPVDESVQLAASIAKPALVGASGSADVSQPSKPRQAIIM